MNRAVECTSQFVAIIDDPECIESANCTNYKVIKFR